MSPAVPLLFLAGLSCGVCLPAFLILRLIPSLSAGRRYLIWQTAFAIIFAGSPLAFVEVRVAVPVLPARAIVLPSIISQPHSRFDTPPGQPAPASAMPVARDLPPASSRQTRSLDFVPLLHVLWLAGAATILGRSVAGFLYLRGIRRRARFLGCSDAGGNFSPGGVRGFRIHASPEISVPMAAGIFRPSVLLPDALLPCEGAHLRSILLHEISHLRRGDVAVLALARIVLAVHWFNPLIWFAMAQLRAESELSADDEATMQHVSPEDYAECLLAVVRRLKAAGRPLFPVVEMACTPDITPRLTRLLDARLDRTSPSGRLRGLTVAGAALLAVAFLALRPVAAQSPASTPATDEKNPVVVRCLDGDGKPVAGAEVYLYERPGKRLMYQNGYSQSEFAFDPLTTSEGGEASFALHGDESLVRVLARLPGRLVGAVEETEPSRGESLTVRMYPAGRITGEVSVKGGGLDGVKVRLLSWSLMNTGRYESFLAYPSLEPRAFPSFMEVQPDDNGHFELPDVPASANAAVAAFGPGYGLSQALSMPGHAEPVTISLEREAVIEGVLRDAATGAPVPAAGITVRANPHHYVPGDLIPYEAVTDARGFYRIGALREGSWTITLDWSGTWAMQQVDVDVRTGSTKIVDLTREKGTVISGQVTGEGNGLPISGVMISAVSGDAGGEGLDSSTTKDDGRFSLVLPSGNSLLYVASSPQGFAYPAQQGRRVISIRDGKIIAGSPDFSLKTDTAPRAKPAHATGRVIDEHGNPLANVLISMKLEPLSPSNSSGLGPQGGPIDSTGSDGTYKLSLHPNCRYRIIAGGVTHSSVEAEPFDTGSGTVHKIEDLVVRSANAIAEGTVVNDRGEPIANAEIHPTSAHKYAWAANRITTDNAGHFRIPNLLADEPFDLSVSVSGFGTNVIRNLTPGSKNIVVIISPEPDKPLAGIVHSINFAAVSWKPSATSNVMKYQNRNDPEILNVEDKPIITEADIAGVERVPASGAGLKLILTSAGEKKFNEGIKNLSGKRIAIIVDGKVVAAPVLRAASFGRDLTIDGNMTEEEVRSLVNDLKTAQSSTR